MFNKFFKICSVFAASLYAFSCVGQICYSEIALSSSPDSQFTIDQDLGIATDEKTGLSWMICSAGMVWDTTTQSCTGVATYFNWSEALQYAEQSNYADYSNWRVPNVKELMSIVERQCESPAINTNVFVDAINERFWSSTPVIDSDGAGGIIGDQVWAVSFIEGSNNTPNKTEFSFVRLVRKIQ